MRKELRLLCICLVCSFCAMAQFEKGKVQLGGDILYLSGNSHLNYPPGTDSKSQTILLNTSVGKFIDQRTLIGINAGFSTSTYGVNIPNSNAKRNTYSAGLFIRKYKPVSKDFSLFAETGLNYSYSDNFDSSNQVVYSYQVKQSVESLNIRAGVCYKISKRMSVDLAIPDILFVGLEQNKYPSNSKTNEFVVRSGLNTSLLNNVSIGFRFIL